MAELSTAEKIRIILKRKSMTVKELAEMTGQSRQNLTQKLDRDNFSEREIREMAEKMGVRFESHFILENGDQL